MNPKMLQRMVVNGALGGQFLKVVPFTLSASDSFNRANGALGTTDGVGIDGIAGGSGLSWVEQVGTWGITSNRARANTVVANNAIATVDTGKTDGVICAKITTSSAGGVIARYVDANNYARVRVTTTSIDVIQIIGGASTTLWSLASVVYIADADIVVRLDGNRISLEYNGEYYGSWALDVSLAASTLHGIYVNAAGSGLNISEWHFINLPEFQVIEHPSILQPLTGEYLITTPLRGESGVRCAEWDVRQEKVKISGYTWTSNTRHLFGLKLVTIANGSKVVLSDGQGWEAAGSIGADADLEATYNYFGSIHQNEQCQSCVVSVRGMASVPRWKRVYCTSLTIDQNINTIYPADKTSVIGTTKMRHSFDSAGLRVNRTHTYQPGYKIYTFYGAMMPINNPLLDTYQVGENASAVMVMDGNPKNLNTETSIFKSWAAGGNYRVVMSLPTGGPSDPADWSKAVGFKGWFKDNADGKGKHYVNFVSGNFADRVTAETSSHIVQYWVEKQ